MNVLPSGTARGRQDSHVVQTGCSDRTEHARFGRIRDSESMSTFPMTRTYSNSLDLPGEENDVECCDETPRATLVEHPESRFNVTIDTYHDDELGSLNRKCTSAKSNISPLSPKSRVKKSPAHAKNRLAKKLGIRIK